MKQTIKQRRKLLKLSQQDLADALKTTRQRISDLETLRFHPHDHEKVALGEHLKCDPNDLVFRPQPLRKTEPVETTELVQRFRHKPSFRHPRDRSGESRLYAVRKHYADIIPNLDQLLESADVTQFVDDAPFGSAFETAAWLAVVNREQARPTEAAPLFTGYDQHSVVCPKTRRYVGHCRMPALVTERYLAILQVSVETPNLYTMDALVCTFHGGERFHFAVELEGPGKPPPCRKRDRALGIPILRFTKAEVLAGIGIGDKLDEYFAARDAQKARSA